jgi:hypothetical protein
MHDADVEENFGVAAGSLMPFRIFGGYSFFFGA